MTRRKNVNFVEMWKSRSASPMKLPDWNPRKSVEDYKKKVRLSVCYNFCLLVRISADDHLLCNIIVLKDSFKAESRWSN